MVNTKLVKLQDGLFQLFTHSDFAFEVVGFSFTRDPKALWYVLAVGVLPQRPPTYPLVSRLPSYVF